MKEARLARQHSHDVLETAELKGGEETSDARVGAEEGLTTKGQRGILEGDRTVLYLDCDGGYTNVHI